MSRSKTAPFYIALISAFTVASSLIYVPLYKSGILSLIVALVAAIIIVLAFTALQNLFIGKCSNRVILKITGIIIALSAIFLAALSFKEYTVFIYDAVLLRSNIWVIKAVFAFCVFYLAKSQRDAVYKFAFLSCLLSSAVFLFLFILSAKTFDIKNLSGIFSLSAFSLKQSGMYLVKLFLPSLAAVVFIGSDDKKIPVFLPAVGTFYGAVLCLITVFDSVLSFGLPLAAKIKYPYISDISTVSVGNLFTRMDGFAYFAFFACYILKCAVCLKLAAKLLCYKKPKLKKPLLALFSAVLIFLA